MPQSTRQQFRAALKPGAALILPGVADALANIVIGGKTPEHPNAELSAERQRLVDIQSFQDIERKYK